MSETKEKKINIYSQVHTKSSLVLSLAKECNVEVLSYQEMLVGGLCSRVGGGCHLRDIFVFRNYSFALSVSMSIFN